MNKIYFCLLLSILECLHNYATVMIVFFVFLFSVCAKQGLWEDLGESLLDLAEKTETFLLMRFVVMFFTEECF